MKKTVLITGTSSGIGKASAKYFQQKGWNVAATMRSPEKENELNTLEGVSCIPLDVTNSESIQNGIEEAIRQFTVIDVLVNNAGYGLVGAFELSSAEQIRNQFDTNVFGLMEVTRAILPHLRQQQQGAIINVASMSGRITFPLYSLYHASKWAVEGFSESLQHELKPFNIKVKLIEPGVIGTEFIGRSKEVTTNSEIKAYDGYVDKVLERLLLFYKVATPAEKVAKIIYKAATNKSSKLRYPIGLDADSLLLLRKLLPDRIFLGAINKSLTW